MLILHFTANDLAEIQWDGGSNALITYSPTVEQQKVASQDGVSGQFVVQYDVERDRDAGEIQAGLLSTPSTHLSHSRSSCHS